MAGAGALALFHDAPSGPRQRGTGKVIFTGLAVAAPACAGRLTGHRAGDWRSYLHRDRPATGGSASGCECREGPGINRKEPRSVCKFRLAGRSGRSEPGAGHFRVSFGEMGEAVIRTGIGALIISALMVCPAA